MPFIVGAPRSGTTLLRLMLDAHPELAIPPETFFVPAVCGLASPCVETSLDAADTSVCATALRRRFYETVTSCERWHDFQMHDGELWQRLAGIEPFDIASGLRAFYALYAARLGKPRWGEKTPEYGLHAGTIQAVLPEAHFVHIVRDGRAVMLSNLETWWGWRRSVREWAGWWAEMVIEMRRQGELCPHWLEIRYEDLVADAGPMLEKVCAFLSLPNRSEMLEYHGRAQARLEEIGDLLHPNRELRASKERRLSLHRLNLQPPDRSRAERWRSQLTEQQKLEFEGVAGDLLRNLGYATESRPSGSGA